MKIFQLKDASTNQLLDVWGCGKCGALWRREDVAERCCLCSICGEPVGREDFWGSGLSKRHQDCETAKGHEMMARRMQEAEKIDVWAGWVFHEGAGHKEGYFNSIEDYEDWLAYELEGDWPEYVFVCKEQPCVEHGDAMADRIIEGIIVNDGWEDMEETDLKGLDEFRAACRAFSEANKDIHTYYPDFTRAAKVSLRQDNA